MLPFTVLGRLPLSRNSSPDSPVEFVESSRSENPITLYSFGTIQSGKILSAKPLMPRDAASIAAYSFLLVSGDVQYCTVLGPWLPILASSSSLRPEIPKGEIFELVVFFLLLGF